MQDNIKNDLINSYYNNNYEEIINNIVIPNFNNIVCNLDEIIDCINNKYNIENESLNYIENIFNVNLYNSILSTLNNNNNDNLTHYFIVLIEFIKYERYQKIINKMENMNLENNDISKTMIFDNLLNATKISLNNCLSRIKLTNDNLNEHFKEFNLSKFAIHNLLEMNNLLNI